MWGKYPGWMMEQDRQTRIELLAWYRVHVDPSPPKKARRSRKVRVKDETAASFWGV